MLPNTMNPGNGLHPSWVQMLLLPENSSALAQASTAVGLNPLLIAAPMSQEYNIHYLHSRSQTFINALLDRAMLRHSHQTLDSSYRENEADMMSGVRFSLIDKLPVPMANTKS